MTHMTTHQPTTTRGGFALVRRSAPQARAVALRQDLGVAIRYRAFAMGEHR